MKKIIILLISVAAVFVSCETQQDVIDTGVSDPIFDGSMMDYLRSNEFNWGLTVEMIEKAGLVDLFEGNDPDYPEITFLGFTTYSIYHYLYPLDMQDISSLTQEECRDFVMMHIVKGRYLKEDFEFRDLNYLINDPDQTGFTEITTEGDKPLRAYQESSPYAGVPYAGPVIMGLYSLDKQVNIPVASPDIQPSNGVVHALNYDYILGNL